MDELGLGSPEGASLPGMRDDNINISDVIEVIETDPDFTQSSNMFNGGSEIPQPTTLPSMAPVRASKRLVKIIEQPASKALRFRYECEGRSAGSIPGISSTPENKTFPAIQIMGYQGRAVVVVSCVTKDAPHRPHPHNLVGREGCKKGVCTLEVSPETMSVTFSNLGIQCVKKKDIESALKVREEIRVDPFRTGFQHRNQPTTIDLNAVRLCFQVFLEGDQRGKFTVPLTPVISEPIYDKKAMCDLIIIKLSDCVSSVDGGRKDIILLCEKVAKEDIQIRFYEERDGQLVWEGLGDFQPSQVHKQTAIWFRAPRYKTLDVTEPVKVYIQLRRPSDGATSEPLPFELLPLDSGRPAFWSFRRNLAKKGNYNLFSTILANDARLVAKRQLSNNNMSPPLPPQNGKDGVDSSQNVLDTDVEMVGVTQLSDKPEQTQGALEWCDYSEVGKRSKEPEPQVSEEKSFNELINQVAELDEIYSESRARSNLDEAFDQEKVMRDESFDDARTYTSLQLAFKNPLELDISDKDKYEDVTIVNPQGPIIDVSSLKRENELDKLPPLPPKRAKKVTDICDPYIPNVTTGSTRSIQMTVKQTEAGNNPCVIGKPVGRSSSFSLPRPRSQSEVPLPPGKKLPPTPCSTLPNPKKKSFFSKLFSRKKDKWSTQSLDAIKPDSRHSLTTSKIMLLGGSPSAARGSTGSVAAHSVHSNTDSIGPHSLMQDNATNFNENNSSEDVTNKTINNTDLNANDDLNMNLDLTEAEHYALYMAMAPHATQSEFDEMSSYYSPVEGGKIIADPSALPRLRDSKT